MDMSHEWFVSVARSFGLFYLIALFIGITIYAYWPSLGKKFDRAAKSILDDEDGPRPPKSEPEQETTPCR